MIWVYIILALVVLLTLIALAFSLAISLADDLKATAKNAVASIEPQAKKALDRLLYRMDKQNEILERLLIELSRK
jgi:hypothetical protein